MLAGKAVVDCPAVTVRAEVVDWVVATLEAGVDVAAIFAIGGFAGVVMTVPILPVGLAEPGAGRAVPLKVDEIVTN